MSIKKCASAGIVLRQRRWGVAMQRTPTRCWEEAAPLIQGWGFVYWEARAFGGKKLQVCPSLRTKYPSKRSPQDKVGLRFHPAWGSSAA
jgi:hypothetical protein